MLNICPRMTWIFQVMCLSAPYMQKWQIRKRLRCGFGGLICHSYLAFNSNTENRNLQYRRSGFDARFFWLWITCFSTPRNQNNRRVLHVTLPFCSNIQHMFLFAQYGTITFKGQLLKWVFIDISSQKYTCQHPTKGNCRQSSLERSTKQWQQC